MQVFKNLQAQSALLLCICIFAIRMKYIVLSLLTAFLLSKPAGLQAQDVNFTQAFAAPQNLNPALSGNIEGTYRIMTIYRDQWRAGIENTIATFAVGGDVKFNVSPDQGKQSDIVGLGVFFFADQGDIFEMNTNRLALQSAYHKKLGKKTNNFLALGVEFGIQQRNINYDNLNFGDEFDNINAYSQQTSEILPPNNFGFLDLGIGLSYNANPSPGLKYYVGIAAHHFNSPYLSFFRKSQAPNPDTELEFRYYPRYSAQLSLNTKLNQTLSFIPRVLYVSQGEHSEANVAAQFKFSFFEARSALYTGIWLKNVHGVDGLKPRYVSPSVGIQRGGFIIGLSYDVYLAETLVGNPGLNGFELSLRFIGEHDNEFNFCPQF